MSHPNSTVFSREHALATLQEQVKNPRMLQHSLASEAVMRALALHLGADPDKWGLAGLLHDLDVETTDADPRRHGLESARQLEAMGLDPEIVDAIRAHNEVATGKPRETPFQFALAAGETITGLITATTLVYPDKKLASVQPKSVVKRMKEKAFAASVKRENILECERLGLPLAEFAELSVNAMREIHESLGL